MFNQQGGLMLEQAPPIFSVLRFFITGSIFGVLLGLFLIGSELNLFSISDYSRDLIATHFLFLGVEASFMIGALFQMLPVLAGVVIKVPNRNSLIVNTLLIFGIIFQAIFFYTFNKLSYLLTVFILGGVLLYIIFLMLKELVRVQTHSNTSKGMAFALGGLGVTVIFGIFMLILLNSHQITLYDFAKLREFHYSFGMVGWVTLLIVAISFQVIEMFFVTPKYPDLLYKYLIPTLFTLLFIKIFFDFYIDEVIGVLLIIYSVATIYLLTKRRRPTSDASVWFWRLSMGILILFGFSLFFNNLEFSYMLFIGFSLSVILAMVYKIVPFLVWFHLSSQGYMKAPMMHEVISPKMAKRHFFLHLVFIIVLISNVFINFKLLNVVLYMLFTLSFGFLALNIIKGALKYKETRENSTPMRW